MLSRMSRNKFMHGRQGNCSNQFELRIKCQHKHSNEFMNARDVNCSNAHTSLHSNVGTPRWARHRLAHRVPLDSARPPHLSRPSLHKAVNAKVLPRTNLVAFHHSDGILGNVVPLLNIKNQVLGL